MSKQMKVIGHEAIRAKGEVMLRGRVRKHGKCPTSEAGRTEIRGSIAGADSKEISAWADVVVLWQADGFVKA